MCTADTSLYSKCDQASDLWQQLKLATDFKSDLQSTAEWSTNWLVDFPQLLLFDRSNISGAIGVKTDRFFLKKKHIWRFWDSTSLQNWIGTLTLSLLPRLSQATAWIYYINYRNRSVRMLPFHLLPLLNLCS